MNSTDERKPPCERVSDVETIQKSLVEAVREALARHKRAGNPVAVWRNERVEWIRPEDIPVGVDEGD